MARGLWFSLCLCTWLTACGDDAGPAPPDGPLEGFQGPDLVCPGDPSCRSEGDGVLRVGAGKRAYTPRNFETYTDENGDREWQRDEPFTDLNGNGKFDGVWLFGGGRAALAVETEIEARALAFVQGDTTVVVLYIDSVGLLSGDMDVIRRHPALSGLAIDHLVIGTTHAHDTPDTIGLWGADATSTGRQPFVLEAMYDAAADAVKQAVESAEPATMVIASTKLLNDPANPQGLTDDWNKDIRDPVIFDPTITIARFVRAAEPRATIGTLVNWANHPEVSHFSDTDGSEITAHYPHWLREHIEQGVTMQQSSYAATDLPGLGGVTVFVQGALGGQIGSLRGTHPRGPDGTPITEVSHAMDRAIGTNAAAVALAALASTGESVGELPLSIKSAMFHARIDNVFFHVAFLIDLIGPHPLVGYDPEQPIDVGNLPWLPIRSTFVQIGPLGFVTVPGELHPELWVGGYDGSWSWGWPLYDDTKANLPRFDEAPPPPYMRDLVLAHEGVRYPVVAGMAEDYIGYIVPAYNYALDPANPYIVEAEGDHYEEVYSLGPLVEQHAIHPVLELLRYRRP
ncbi:MAG: hypothetical protein ACTHU0_10505 [Kofleriaceae bacterium]